MRLSTLALALAPVAWAQSSSASASASASSSSASGGASAQYLQTVLGALTQAGLTSLVSVAGAIANTSDGNALLNALSQGNHTVFAPSNDAFNQVPQNVSSNTTLLTQILAYHVLNNFVTVNGTQQAPNHTIVRTALQGGGYSLPGNKTAPLVLSKNSTNATVFQINQATDNVTASGPNMAANLYVYVIGEVLSLPMSLGSAVSALLPTLAGVVQQSGLLAPLQAAQAITVFAPSDMALQGITSQLGSLNATQIQTILANHVINGTIAYSDRLTTTNYTSAAGEPFRFMSNSSGAYVMSANSTAKIIQSDIIIQNGVVHVIDGVLLNTMSDTNAAASAYSSNIAAATSAEPSGPVTASSSAAASGASGSSGASSSRSAGDSRMDLGFSSGAVVGMLASVVGAVVGGGWLLL